MYRIKNGSLVTLYREGADMGLAILAENLPDDPDSHVRRVRVVQDNKSKVVDSVWYTLIPVDEADICET
jgi:hypothetical protein